MPWYSIALFLHIVGALGLFAGISLEQAGLRGLRRASTTAALREWLTVLSARGRIEGPAGVVLLATGGYMAATGWGRQPWIALALLGLVLIALLGALATGRTVRALRSALPNDDLPVRFALRQRIDSPVLRTSAALRAALALGIVFNMAVKPDARGAALALAAALLLGALAPWIGRRGSLAAPEYGTEH
ncbi:MAG TPA: hypothetical protein VFQ38_13225 [Longimicrobiales bacterium]|nr:hypothetical protein [Longimicrobiales bacterium]